MPTTTRRDGVTAFINQSVDLLQRGDASQAAVLLRQVLEDEPGHPDALHLLSVASFQLGSVPEAAELAIRATQAAPDRADYHSNLGRYYLALNRLPEAESELHRALALAPKHAMARYNLASVLSAQGRREEALQEARQHAELFPRQAAAQHLIATLLSECGRPAESLAVFERALSLEALPETHNNYGNALQSLGRSADAVMQYEKALRLRNRYPEAASNLGAALLSLGHEADARLWFEQALAMQPDLLQARVNLINLEAASAEPARAVELYRALLAESPTAETWNNLANAMQDQGRFEEARQAYDCALELNPAYFLVYNNIGNMLRRQGRPDEALGWFERALGHNAQFAEAWNNRGVALADLGRLAEAQESYARSIAAKPGYPDPWINQGNLHRDAGRPGAAAASYQRAVELAPRNAYAWNNLGCALGDRNEIAEAIHCYERAVALMPANHAAFSNILLNLHYLDEPTPEEMFEAHRQFGERYDALGDSLRAPHGNVRDADRKLRVGYVSADFRRHSCAFFLEPVLDRHRVSEDVEAFCYSDVARPDAQTLRFAAMAGPRWRDIRGYSRERFAEQVRADGIDILVDVGGHTAHSRLADFTARPAPLQVSWLGYPDTTGLPSIQYRITDAWADPVGEAERRNTETLVRLDGGFLCFRPPTGVPEPAAAPSLAGAPFTFGSFNNLSKISPSTVGLWAAILREAPGSRLAIKNRSLNEAEARLWLLGQFAKHGIGEDRIWLSGLIEDLAGHLDSYRLVDVALDTLPYHGTTTTCEALWMGVPVITLAGRTHASRVGVSLLSGVGLTGLIASNREDYLQKAIAIWRNGDDLARWRKDLRRRMTESPLREEAGFARKLEAAYRGMWRRWCGEGQQ